MKPKPIRIGGKDLALDSQVYVVAEIGINHGGSLVEALKLVDAAAACGADAVKFQTFRANRLMIDTRDRFAQQDAGTETAFELFRRMELSWDDHKKLKAYADRKGITFLSTPFDEESADFLDGLGVSAFKVASSDLTHKPLLRRIAAKKKPVLISTGMSFLTEVGEAVDVLKTAGCDEIILLHCVSSYPAAPETLNLRAIRTLQKEFSRLTGYSDHSEGILFPLLAAALGAVVIEKHFTLDKNAPGPDHKVSMNPADLRELVANLRMAERSLGDGQKRPFEGEGRNRELSRRSIVAATDLRAGQAISEPVLTFKRPGTGIEPGEAHKMIGMRARRDIKADTILSWDDLTPSRTNQQNITESSQCAK
jgi:N,N'-diacetyllegionaminate synthase